MIVLYFFLRKVEGFKGYNEIDQWTVMTNSSKTIGNHTVSNLFHSLKNRKIHLSFLTGGSFVYSNRMPAFSQASMVSLSQTDA